jgi:uncharacterized protein
MYRVLRLIYRIINNRNGNIIANNATLASSFSMRLRGLIGKDSLSMGKAMIIPNCQIVHMFFMKFPIDVIFCDNHYQILYIQHSLKPWRISKFVKNAYYVIELPNHTIEQSNIIIGDLLEITS